ncbi:hypothetical protein [Paludisphaera borealis]|uniref:DUF1257 domain-containing protein n=1 Tax=Paludisphaera borealis TaxID=1387353 RepID=A0A1U7CWC0_9BACT|nr:hypothetical protein [Paludisphaera borealis]APW63221.1 hypothetical protein BSF38_04785 [Paludisphaera borealis]MDR3623070.1 hypothetical protein [Paludisphaera borealis]
MSHVVVIATKVQDPVAVAAACRRLGLAEPVYGSAELFSGEVAGLVVRLPDWVYPVVVDTTTGRVAYDDFEGRWGDPKQLDRFLQVYAVEKAKLEAKRKGYSVSEQALHDGSIRVEIVEAR